jgi:DNA-binding NarL/FixJ family response regulator
MDTVARLLLADDHPMMCEGLRAILEPANQVVGVVHDGREVPAAVTLLEPDLVLLDISLPGRNGLDLARELHQTHPELKTMILTMHAERLYADEALRAGARGFVVKLAVGSELRFAVSEVLAGRTYVTSLLAGSPVSPMEDMRGADGAARGNGAGVVVGSEGASGAIRSHGLTPRQLEVLRLLAKGCTTAEIASELGLTQKGVEFHKARIKRALGLNSRAALVRFAVANGIV